MLTVHLFHLSAHPLRQWMFTNECLILWHSSYSYVHIGGIDLLSSHRCNLWIPDLYILKSKLTLVTPLCYSYTSQRQLAREFPTSQASTTWNPGLISIRKSPSKDSIKWQDTTPLSPSLERTIKPNRTSFVRPTFSKFPWNMNLWQNSFWSILLFLSLNNVWFQL